jgi:hypothetical protein
MITLPRGNARFGFDCALRQARVRSGSSLRTDRELPADRRVVVPERSPRFCRERRPKVHLADVIWRRSAVSNLEEQTMANYPTPPFDTPRQPMPGTTEAMSPVPDHGEQTYRGSGRLTGRKAVITGGDSGIGRAVAIAYAREGADVLIAYPRQQRGASGKLQGYKRDQR